MSMPPGMELLAIGRSSWIEVRYEGGTYTNPKGEPLDDIGDWSCYSCMSSYYTLMSDPPPFCPACGLIEGRRFHKLEELQAHLRGQDWSFLDGVGRGAYAVTTDGVWELRFAKEAYDLERTRKHGQIRAIHEPPRGRRR